MAFGNVLGADGKMFKTRRGDTVKLVDLLDEAVQRAEAAQAGRDPDQDRVERAEVGRRSSASAPSSTPTCRPNASATTPSTGTGCWRFEGDTAAYVQYAHARVRSIFRTGEISPDEAAAAPGPGVEFTDPHERALAMQVLGFNEAVQQAAELSRPTSSPPTSTGWRARSPPFTTGARS